MESVVGIGGRALLFGVEGGRRRWDVWEPATVGPGHVGGRRRRDAREDIAVGTRGRATGTRGRVSPSRSKPGHRRIRRSGAAGAGRSGAVVEYERCSVLVFRW
jgi:hypothetical protein